jgi:hypothetical protein
MKSLNALIVPSLFYLLVAIASEGTVKGEASEYQHKLNGGYYLLHKLYEDEEQVPFLLDIKTAPPNVSSFADQVSKTAKAGLATLDKMRESDASINWDSNPLPAIEQEVRDSIKSEKQHQLLFGTKGPDFERAFLVSQAEASMYAENISKVLAGQDKNPDHVRDLNRMSEKWHAIYEEIFRMLRSS